MFQRPRAGGQGGSGTRRLERAPAGAGWPAPVRLVRHRHRGRRPRFRRRRDRVRQLVGHRGADTGRGAAGGPPVRLTREPGRLSRPRRCGERPDRHRPGRQLRPGERRDRDGRGFPTTTTRGRRGGVGAVPACPRHGGRGGGTGGGAIPGPPARSGVTRSLLRTHPEGDPALTTRPPGNRPALRRTRRDDHIVRPDPADAGTDRFRPRRGGASSPTSLSRREPWDHCPWSSSPTAGTATRRSTSRCCSSGPRRASSWRPPSSPTRPTCTPARP